MLTERFREWVNAHDSDKQRISDEIMTSNNVPCEDPGYQFADWWESDCDKTCKHSEPQCSNGFLLCPISRSVCYALGGVCNEEVLTATKSFTECPFFEEKDDEQS